MKHLFRYSFVLIVSISFFSCKKDNYSAPGTFLTGALLYNTDSIYLERNQVTYQIYQYGFGKVGQIGSNSSDGDSVGVVSLCTVSVTSLSNSVPAIVPSTTYPVVLRCRCRCRSLRLKSFITSERILRLRASLATGAASSPTNSAGETCTNSSCRIAGIV